MAKENTKTKMAEKKKTNKDNSVRLDGRTEKEAIWAHENPYAVPDTIWEDEKMEKSLQKYLSKKR